MLQPMTSDRLMDSIYRHQRHIYDITRKYYLLGRDQLINELEVPNGGTALELGCGTGRNLIAASRKYPNAIFYGLDISEAMLEKAEEQIQRANLSHRIHLAKADATNCNCFDVFGVDAFDRVFFSYSLSMIPPWKRALENATKLVKPGGALHLVDFGQQEELPKVFRSLLFRWLHKFHVEPRADLQDDLLYLRGQTEGELAFQSLYRGYAWKAQLKMPRLLSYE
ncbi:class I SAM-dependent methyltransferase [Polycladidibacter stylochi]|uniref:class I SAM-dependent methyltransferase n=1 Tax=Polycladidibacter stylochi TaxID=1807766 RepID=UPI00083452C6|nr:class I SAM-dependent methyltransferase [Pseudovibrio stylochi]